MRITKGPKKKKLYEELESARKAYDKIRAQLATLQAQHVSLVIKHGFLVGICEFLAHMRGWSASSSLEHMQHEASDRQTPVVKKEEDDIEAAAAAAAGAAETAEVQGSNFPRSDSEQLLLQLLQGLPSIAEEQQTACAASNECRGGGSSSSCSMAVDPNSAAAAAADATHSAARLHAGEGAAAAAAAAGSSDGSLVDQLFEPGGDGVALMKRLMQMPPIPVDTLSAQDAVSRYARTVRELSVQLHIYRACQAEHQGMLAASSQQQQLGRQPLQRMKAALTQHFRLLMSLVQAGKEDLVFSLCVTDFETGEQLSAIPMELHRFTTRQINLTQEQKHRLAATHTVYQEFLHGLGAQVPLLLQQGSNPDSSSSSGGSSGTFADLQSLSKLPQNMQLWAGVNRLQRKELVLRAVATCFVIASLTTVQLAELAVYSSPYAAIVLKTAQAAAEDLQEEQQQLQQQMGGLQQRGRPGKLR